jgi:hypothetical protein
MGRAIGKGKAPAAPDPYATAQAQQQTNAESARVEARMNRGNTFTPYGSVTNTDIGGDRWETRVNLSPEQEALYRQSVELDTRTGQMALDALPRMQRIIGSDVDTGSLPAWQTDDADARDRATAGIMSRMEPQFARDREALEGRLLAQGFVPGSEAYTRAADELGRNVNDARMQAITAGLGESRAAAGFSNATRGQRLAEMLQLRAQPINEVAALFGLGPGMQMPQAQQQAPVSVAAPDLMGGIYQNYAAKNQAQQATNANWFGLLGSAARAGASYFGGPFGAAAAAALPGR